VTGAAVMQSPLGPLVLRAEGDALAAISIADEPAATTQASGVLALAREQLEAYFSGELRAFDLPLAPGGTTFDRRVWAAVGAVPFGRTTSYGALAASLGAPRAARAVGHANGRNPLPIVIPCHRLVGADGRLTGYRYGVERKRALLEHESANRGYTLLAAPDRHTIGTDSRVLTR
jgi:methylated-DNA-[protein]-cysteine S-methyltransferase